jgi:activating signal cointegrator 1
VKTLTLTQPWASLVAIGAKKIETRSWQTQYRGPLAIHAAKSFPASTKDLCYMSPFKEALGMPDGTHLLHADPPPAWVAEARRMLRALPLGYIIATAQLVNVLPTEVLDNSANTFSVSFEPISEQERAFGDYSPGRFAWILEDVHILSQPIHAKGAVGLWDFNGIMV